MWIEQDPIEYSQSPACEGQTSAKAKGWLSSRCWRPLSNRLLSIRLLNLGQTDGCRRPLEHHLADNVKVSPYIERCSSSVIIRGMKVKPHADVASLPSGCLLQNTNKQKRQKLISFGEDVEKLELL